jgi:DNA repair protein RadC
MEDFEKLSIKQWAEEDRPREKLLLRGRNSLTDAELIAILIGSGNSKESAVQLSQRILLSVNGNLDSLGKLNIDNLTQFKGIGQAKAISIIAALEIGRRRLSTTAIEKPRIQSSKMAYEFIIGDMMDLQHEEFWCIFLNRRNEVIKKFQLSKGGISGTLADIRLVFKAAIECLASSMFLFHNHPSGNLQPSEPDKKLTSKFIEVGKLLDIQVIDHIIVTDKAYFSFADNGLVN